MITLGKRPRSPQNSIQTLLEVDLYSYNSILTFIEEFDVSKRRIVGITTARAVRLEAASGKGQLVVDLATFDALREDLRRLYGVEETIEGKREERYKARRCTLINVLPAETALEGA